jgi:hypothetical protein
VNMGIFVQNGRCPILFIPALYVAVEFCKILRKMLTGNNYVVLGGQAKAFVLGKTSSLLIAALLLFLVLCLWVHIIPFHYHPY